LTSRKLPRLRAVVCALAMLAAACSATGSYGEGAEPSSGDSDAADAGDAGGGAGADSDAESVSSSAPASVADDGAGEPADGAANGDDGFTPYDERVYPLSEFVGELVDELFPGHDDEHPMVVIENSTHACMTGQGFRYAMIDWLAMEAEGKAKTPLVSDEEYMTANGYGAADSLDAPEVPFEYDYVDPNIAIRDSLSEGELDAWWAREDECRTEAQNEIMRPGLVRWALQEDRQRLREAVDADPRVAAAWGEWAACMAARGHQYASRDEIFAYLDRFAGPLRARLLEFGGPDNIDPAYQADLDDLKAIEVGIARADLECREPLEQVQYEVEVEHQQRYLDDNEDRLALLRDELPTMTLGGNVHLWVE